MLTTLTNKQRIEKNELDGVPGGGGGLASICVRALRHSLDRIFVRIYPLYGE